MGYRWGYLPHSTRQRVVSSRTYDRLRIRPGEPSKDVRGLPGTSAKVQRISAHLANPNRYVFRQHPGTSADSKSLAGVFLGVSATRLRPIPPRIPRRIASRCVKCRRGSNPTLGFELVTLRAHAFCSRVASKLHRNCFRAAPRHRISPRLGAEAICECADSGDCRQSPLRLTLAAYRLRNGQSVTHTLEPYSSVS